MQNAHVPRPEFNVLSNSNGAIVFTASPILRTGNWIKPFAGIVLALNLDFQHLGLNLQENQMYHSKEP